MLHQAFYCLQYCNLKTQKISNDLCSGKDCMKKFCESLIEHIIKINDFKKKKVKLQTIEQNDSQSNAKICYICKEKFGDKYAKDKKIQ